MCGGCRWNCAVLTFCYGKISHWFSQSPPTHWKHHKNLNFPKSVSYTVFGSQFASFIYSRVHINTSQIGCWGSNHLKFGTGDLEELLNEKIYSIFNSSPERQLFWKYMRLKRAQWLDSCKWFALVCFFTRFIFLAIFWSDF